MVEGPVLHNLMSAGNAINWVTGQVIVDDLEVKEDLNVVIAEEAFREVKAPIAEETEVKEVADEIAVIVVVEMMVDLRN